MIFGSIGNSASRAASVPRTRKRHGRLTLLKFSLLSVGKMLTLKKRLAQSLTDTAIGSDPVRIRIFTMEVRIEKLSTGTGFALGRITD